MPTFMDRFSRKFSMYLVAVFVALPDEGEGYVKVFRQRDRRYGTPELVETVKRTAAKFHALEPEAERLQVGDLSAEKPGRIKGHQTHDQGIDADIVYLRIKPEEQDPVFENPAISGKWKEDFVRPDDQGVTENFNLARNWRLIRLLLEDRASTRVQYILLDQQVLQALSDYTQSRGEHKIWESFLPHLKVRPRHRTHLHMRVKP